LLLLHDSRTVRARVLQALGNVKPEIAERWLPSIERMIGDESPEVRAAAISALANIRNERVIDLIRPYLQDADPRIVTTAAAVLARSGREEDVAASLEILTRLASDTRESAAAARKDVAVATRQIPDPRFRQIWIPLLYDSHPEVAAEAMRSVRALEASDQLFVSTLVSLLRNRSLKSSARDTLVGYGEGVLDILGFLLRDPVEDIWVRRHIPGTIARIPAQRSVDILIEALQDPDSFLRDKAVTGVEKLHREYPELTIDRQPIEALAFKEARSYFNYLTLHYNLFDRGTLSTDGLLAGALRENMARAVDRVYRLLGLIYPWKDIGAARYAIEHGDARLRASALEYVDNLLTPLLRKRLMPLVDDVPIEEKVRRANVVLKTRPRDDEETLLQLINDDDQIVAAAAIDLVEERKLWSLAADIEFVLAHRDAKDWYVFEAASWALAAYRLPEGGRRRLWIEPLPVVQIAARLRHLPVFASVSVAELFRIAGSGRQSRYESGRILYQQGAAPEQLQFMLDGTVTAKAEGQDARSIGPPAALGFEQILEGSAMPVTIRTTETTVCLVLTRDELRTLISANTDLVEGLFRMLARGQQASGRLVFKSHATADVAKLPTHPLTPIEKILVLENVPVFAEIGPNEMAHLVSIAHEVPLNEGSTVFTEADTSAVWAVLAGRLSLESAAGEPPVTLEAGDGVGVYDTLAGAGNGRRAVVVRAGRALRIEREELFELLGERPELLQELFGALFRAPSRTDGRAGVRVAAV
jgi:HEAT repeats/Cyclic nucleotide-binding domain